MEVYLIRHTEVGVETGICYGWTDVPLAGNFEEKKNEVLANLPIEIDAVFSSPLSRCVKLASQIHKNPFLDDRLKELNFGVWEGKYWNNLPETGYREWLNNFFELKCPGGESYNDLIERVSDFFEDLIKTKNKKVAIVSHAGVIRVIACMLTNQDARDAFSNYPTIDFGKVMKFDYRK